MRSAAEAVAYARALHSLVVWLGICDGNMQEGSFRCDANVSVRPVGQKEFGTRTEIKNVNSFRFLERAIQYEARRQIELIEDGGTVVQETRLYDADRDETRSMRSKEDAHDYRYFPDPDLPPLVISRAWVDEVRAAMPELPAALRPLRVRLRPDRLRRRPAQRQPRPGRLLRGRGAGAARRPGQAGRQLDHGRGRRHAQQGRKDIADAPVQAPALAALINRIIDGTISNKIAREVFGAMWAGENGGQPDAIIEARGLKQISDTGAIGAMIDEVLAANAAIVEEYRAGKQKAFNSLVGQIMKAARGKANPQQVNDLLKQSWTADRVSALSDQLRAAAYCRGLLLAKNGRVDIRLETRAMTMPYLSVPLEQVAARLDEMIQAARDGACVVITQTARRMPAFARSIPC